MIKVCYITHEPNLTGASQSLLDIIDGIQNDDIEPIVLLRKHGPLEEELKKRRIKYRIMFYAQTVRSAKAQKKIKRFLKNIVNRVQEKRIAFMLKREDVQLVHNNSLFSITGMIAAKKANIPYICHIREYLDEDHELRPLDNNLLKKSIRDANYVVAISNYVYEKYKGDCHRNSSAVLKDGIKTDRYYNNHEKLFKNEITKILLAGRIEPGKGQIDAIKALEFLNKHSVHRYELFIAGGDAPGSTYPTEIRKYIADKSLNNIRVLGFQDLKKLREECDICLICSSNEALGRVAIEGMLAGCLVIGANACATPEIIEDGTTGFLYTAKDHIDLAECIEKATNNKELSGQVARNGQIKAQSFNIDDYIKELERIYCKALKMY